MMIMINKKKKIKWLIVQDWIGLDWDGNDNENNIV